MLSGAQWCSVIQHLLPGDRKICWGNLVQISTVDSSRSRRIIWRITHAVCFAKRLPSSLQVLTRVLHPDKVSVRQERTSKENPKSYSPKGETLEHHQHLNVILNTRGSIYTALLIEHPQVTYRCYKLPCQTKSSRFKSQLK